MSKVENSTVKNMTKVEHIINVEDSTEKNTNAISAISAVNTINVDCTIVCDKGRESPIKWLEAESPYKLKIEQITTGDYAIMIGGRISIVIERKTWEDLAASIKDPLRKANHKKLLDLRDSTGCRIIYLIEGATHAADSKRKHGKIPFDNLQAYLDHVMLRDNCSVIYSSSPADSARRIIGLTRHLCSIVDRGDHTWVKPGNITAGAEDNGIVEDDTSKLKARANKSIEDIRNAAYITLNGVTAVTLPILLRAEVSLRSILLGLADESVIKELSYDSGGRIGNKRAATIIGNSRSITSKIRALAAIPGVTKETAKYLLGKYTIAELYDVDAKDIALCLRSEGGKKIGPALANRIVEVLK